MTPKLPSIRKVDPANLVKGDLIRLSTGPQTPYDTYAKVLDTKKVGDEWHIRWIAVTDVPSDQDDMGVLKARGLVECIPRADWNLMRP